MAQERCRRPDSLLAPQAPAPAAAEFRLSTTRPRPPADSAAPGRLRRRKAVKREQTQERGARSSADTAASALQEAGATQRPQNLQLRAIQACILSAVSEPKQCSGKDLDQSLTPGYLLEEDLDETCVVEKA